MTRVAKLPEPTVTAKVQSDGSGYVAGVTITRDGKERGYKSHANSADAAVADVVKQIIVDPKTSEYVP